MANLNLIKLKVRRGSNDDRKQVLLQAGEIGYVSDFECKRLVVGDGILLGGRSIAAKFYSGSIEGLWTGQSSFAKALSGDIIFNRNDASLYVLTGAKFEFSSNYYNISPKTDGQTITATRTGLLSVQQRGISGSQIHNSVFNTDYGFSVNPTGSLRINNDNISIKLNTEKQLYIDPNDIDWSLLPTTQQSLDQAWISTAEANIVRFGDPTPPPPGGGNITGMVIATTMGGVAINWGDGTTNGNVPSNAPVPHDFYCNINPAPDPFWSNVSICI
jgi:hypothetical protein